MKIPCFIFLPAMTIIMSSAGVYAKTSRRPVCSQPLQEVKPYSVIISEIMADPYPKVALPECEFIEIFNRNPSPVSLGGWKITSGSRTGILPEVILDAFEYAVLCRRQDSASLSTYGVTIVVHGMPAVINHEGAITLRDETGRVIHHVTYSENSYISTSKADGGWTIEMVDQENPCGETNNWIVSKDISGGTPGRQNSVASYNRDMTLPVLLSSAPVSANSVRLVFSEQMDSASLAYSGNYFTSGGIMYPSVVIPEGPSYKTLVLKFSENFNPGSIYTIIPTGSISDCAGNRLEKGITANFALPEKTDSSDIIFSEVLFKASDGNPEFIEIYNRSQKVIDISELEIRLIDNEKSEIQKSLSLDIINYLIFPEKYAVITKDCIALMKNNPSVHQGNVIEARSLFSLPDKEGTLELAAGNQSIDVITYSYKIFDYFMADPDGHSLERTVMDLNNNAAVTWCPSSAVSGCGTPGSENSQRIARSPAADMKVVPDVFSPEGGLISTSAEIIIECKTPGSRITLYVFNAEGNQVKIIAENLVAGTQNSFYWPGIDESGKICPAGIYIIFAVISDISGEVYTFRKGITLIR